MFIELDDFYDYIGEKRRMLISQRTNDQATCLCDKKSEWLRLDYLQLMKLLKCLFKCEIITCNIKIL